MGIRAPAPGEVGVFEATIRLLWRLLRLLLALDDPPSGKRFSTLLDFEPGLSAADRPLGIRGVRL